MSSFQENSKIRPLIITLHILAMCKLGIVLMGLTPLMALQREDISMPSVSRILIQAILLGAFSVLITEAAAFGLSRKRVWGWMLSIVVAVLHLPSFLFPFSFALGWFLLPDSARAGFSNFLKQEIKEGESKN